MTRFVAFIPAVASLIPLLGIASTTNASNCLPCGGCSDPCRTQAVVVSQGCGCSGVAGPTVTGPVAMSALPSGPSILSSGTGVSSSVPAAPPSEMICDPVTTYKVVMQPTYVTEKRAVQVNKTRVETRYRTKTVYNTVPVTETHYRQKVVNVPKTETKTVEYSVLVPVKSEKTVTLTEMVPSWNEVSEEYTVEVPKLVEVPESYTVKVAKLQDESFTYTVNVPQTVTEQRIRTVTNAVPVTKTRTIEICVPTTTMQTVTKDYGHWEMQVIEVAPAVNYQVTGCGTAAYSTSGCSTTEYTTAGYSVNGCGGCSPCGVIQSGCGPAIASAAPINLATSSSCGTTVTRRVWVPNVKTETVPVTTSTTQEQIIPYTVYEQQSEQVPYECTRIVYQPETRTGTKQTVVYVDELRTRNRTVVNYETETRTRTRKELVLTPVEKTETIPYVTYKSETKTKDVTYTVNVPEYTMEPYEVTRYDRVASQEVEEYTVTVPYCDTELVDVQVCKMVPKLVEETITPCAAVRSSIGASALAGPMMPVGTPCDCSGN